MGHKKLETTMIYARAYDQNVADDYFAAMARVEQRLNIVPAPTQEPLLEKTPQPDQVLVWIERLAVPELCQKERLEIAAHLKQVLYLSFTNQLSPPAMAYVG